MVKARLRLLTTFEVTRSPIFAGRGAASIQHGGLLIIQAQLSGLRSSSNATQRRMATRGPLLSSTAIALSLALTDVEYAIEAMTSSIYSSISNQRICMREHPFLSPDHWEI